jgi:hypothetical protein
MACESCLGAEEQACPGDGASTRSRPTSQCHDGYCARLLWGCCGRICGLTSPATATPGRRHRSGLRDADRNADHFCRRSCGQVRSYWRHDVRVSIRDSCLRGHRCQSARPRRVGICCRDGAMWGQCHGNLSLRWYDLASHYIEGRCLLSRRLTSVVKVEQRTGQVDAASQLTGARKPVTLREHWREV